MEIIAIGTQWLEAHHFSWEKLIDLLAYHPEARTALALPLPSTLSSSSHRFTQNLSVFRRDVAEALRCDGSTESCSLDMMS